MRNREEVGVQRKAARPRQQAREFISSVKVADAERELAKRAGVGGGCPQGIV